MALWLVWFLLGIAFAFLELFLPGFIVLFLSMGCFVTAGALLVLDLSLTQQLLVFMATSIGSLLLFRRWLVRVFRGASSHDSHQEYDDFPLGARVKVLETITPERGGRIQYRGTSWDAVADETIEAGSFVEIERHAHSRHVFYVRKID